MFYVTGKLCLQNYSVRNYQHLEDNNIILRPRIAFALEDNELINFNYIKNTSSCRNCFKTDLAMGIDSKTIHHDPRALCPLKTIFNKRAGYERCLHNSIIL